MDPQALDRPRRLVAVAAIIIVAYAAFVAAIPFVLYPNDPRPPWFLERPVALFFLFSAPAFIAAIAAARSARTLVVASGIVCLLQAFIALSGVTIGLLIPALVLLAMGASPHWHLPATQRNDRLAGIAVVVLLGTAWVALLGLTAPRCWIGAANADGTVSIVEVPATDDQLTGPTVVPSGGSGCSSAELTPSGIGLAAALVAVSVVIAARRPTPHSTP